MKTRIQQVTELSHQEIELWQQFVDQNTAYSSPYFQPAFTQSVAEVRHDVRVAVLEQNGDVIGFFPFQHQGTSAVPVGGQLSDAHAVITSDGKPVEWTELLRSCGLQTWKFHYLVANQCPTQNCSSEVTPAAVMNLAGGFDEYASRLSSRNVIKQADRKRRKAERELGKIRLEWDCRNEAMLDQLIKWKSDQYNRSDIADVFQFDWTTSLLKTLWRRSDNQLRGMLSVLYSDERPVAMHFSLRSGEVLHQWFPGYDPASDLQPYSPGAVHLIEEARAACDHGIQRIDLGKTCSYKDRIATDYVDMAEGCVDLSSMSRILRATYQHTYQWLRESRLKSIVQVPGRMIRRFVENRQFD